MAWAENRIREYGQGQQATLLEKLMLGVAHPVALLLVILGVVVLVYGLWVHDWLWTAIGVGFYVLAVLFSPASGWTNRKLEMYRQGQEATWMERRILEHAHPVHFFFAAVGLVMIVYGLWMHSWLWIVAGIILNIAGHVYTWVE